MCRRRCHADVQLRAFHASPNDVYELTSEDLSSAICFFRLFSSILASICTTTGQARGSSFAPEAGDGQ